MKITKEIEEFINLTITEHMQFMSCPMMEQKRCCWLIMLITKIS